MHSQVVGVLLVIGQLVQQGMLPLCVMPTGLFLVAGRQMGRNGRKGKCHSVLIPFTQTVHLDPSECCF